MKPIYFLLALLLFISCKKVDDYKPQYATYTAPDFELIPTKDAKWHVRLEYLDYDVWIPNDINLEAEKDKLSTVDVYITATGKDTFVNGQKFYKYQFEKKYFDFLRDTTYDGQPFHIWLRGDTATQKVYDPSGGVVLDFTDSLNMRQIKPFYNWREVNVDQADSLILGDCYLKRWDMSNIYDTNRRYFYKAVRIGTYSGLLSVSFYVPPSVAQVTSLDFTYKGDSVHFEYPLQ